MVTFMILEIFIPNPIQCHKNMTESQRTALYGSHFSSFGIKKNQLKNLLKYIIYQYRKKIFQVCVACAKSNFLSLNCVFISIKTQHTIRGKDFNSAFIYVVIKKNRLRNINLNYKILNFCQKFLILRGVKQNQEWSCS